MGKKYAATFWTAYAVLVVLVLAVFFFAAGCASGKAEEVAPIAATAHPTGTLLRDGAGNLWIVDLWPGRRAATSEVLDRHHLQDGDAIQMTADEERCLNEDSRPYVSDMDDQELVRVMRNGTDEFWYVDHRARRRYFAPSFVMQARRDDPTFATIMEATVLDRNFLWLGNAWFPDGTLLRVSGDIYYFARGLVHPFASNGLARAAGYNLQNAVEVNVAELRRLATVGSALFTESFQSCPADELASQPGMERDDDHDGVMAYRDCDDGDPNRSPLLRELCDGLDNDCDGVADNGFPVGESCVARAGCRIGSGIVVCLSDGLGAVCAPSGLSCR